MLFAPFAAGATSGGGGGMGCGLHMGKMDKKKLPIKKIRCCIIPSKKLAGWLGSLWGMIPPSTK
jgi:hypothetical protein